MDDLLDIARRQIGTFISKQLAEDMPEAFAKVRRSSPDVSFMGSSRYLLFIDKACAELITQRGTATWEILFRCITNGRVEYSAGLAGELKNFASPFLDGTVGSLVDRAKELVPRYTEGTSLPGAQARALETLETEIDLFCAALKREPQATPYQPPHVINITGSSVNNLQTGHFSTATVTTHATSHEYHQIISAVGKLKNELEAAGITGPAIFLVEETEAELAKPNPNPSRLKSLTDTLSSCATWALDSASKIPGAIDGVKQAISMFPG